MKSIRQRLTVGLLGVFVVLMSAGGTLIYLLTRTALLAQVDARLRIEALAVIKQTKQEREDEHQSATSDLNPASEASPRRELEVGFTDKYLPEFKDGGTEFFQVWSPDGKTVKRSSSLHKTDLPRRAGPLDKPAFWSFRLINGASVRAVGLTFVPPTPARERNWHDPTFRATLVMATELGELNETLAVLRGILIGVGGLGLLATLAVVPGFLRRGLLPLQKVALHAAGLEATTLRTRFPTEDMPLELRPICLRLNELLVRLEQSFERERRFSADVAHELRTPIAELRSLTEVSLKWPESNEAKMEAFQDALAIARQMETVVTSLLAITRCEAGRQTVECESLNVDKIVQECWHPFVAQAEQREISVTFQIPNESYLQTDRVLLGFILTNLFSNAIVYSPLGGAVFVRFGDDPSQAVLSVTNTVDNLTTEDLPRLFERFWRKDPARSPSEHSGLGLALTAVCTEVLGMKRSAYLSNDRQLTIYIESK